MPPFPLRSLFSRFVVLVAGALPLADAATAITLDASDSGPTSRSSTRPA